MLIANIWKVFGVLLEYCSRSDFQTTVSVLENEKKIFVEQLEMIIDKKEKLIQDMESNNKEEREKL